MAVVQYDTMHLVQKEITSEDEASSTLEKHLNCALGIGGNYIILGSFHVKSTEPKSGICFKRCVIHVHKPVACVHDVGLGSLGLKSGCVRSK